MPEFETRTMRRLVITLRDIVEREHGMDAGQAERRLLVDAADQRVRMRASHERDVQQAGQRDVVNEAALAAQQRLVLKAGDARADQGGHWRWYRGGAVSSLPLRAKRVVGRGRGWGVGQIELPPTPARHSASKTRMNALARADPPHRFAGRAISV